MTSPHSNRSESEITLYGQTKYPLESSEVEPSYFVRAKRNETQIVLPVYNVPELEKSVKASAHQIALHLIAFGWTQVKLIQI